MIKKVVFCLVLGTGLYGQGHAQSFNDVLNRAKDVIKTNTGTGKGKGTGLSNADISAGLKQALQIGAKNATSRVSAVNGFLADAAIKVLMPPEAKKVENTLRSIGLGSKVDQAIVAMNRAAEDASGKAVPIFTNAITSMSIADAMGILQGGNNAATQYLKNQTTASLTAAFKPVIQASLDKVQATKYWSVVFNTYNKLPTTRNKINPDLAAYVTERALSGVFVYVAQEEAKIRTNPAAQVTDLLKKVFGGK